MKIKRYFAADMRQAIQMVRLEQGPDAVILSNRNVDGGVEIVAATDYDEAQAKVQMQQFEQNNFEKSSNVSPLKPTKKKPQGVPAEADRRRGPSEPRLRANPNLKRQAQAPIKPTSSAMGQDASIGQMREELQSMREMLESQLSTMAWGMTTEKDPVRVDLLKRLMKLGIGSGLSKSIADEILQDGAAQVARARF